MSELDQIKTTITVSLGLKNRLRAQKGSGTYEDYIGYLLRTRNAVAHDNVVELQKLVRTDAVHTYNAHKIVFSYNKYNHSDNFLFDISIDKIREPIWGREISFEEFEKTVSFIGKSGSMMSYELYFELLSVAIQKEIEPLFKHNGRFEDHYSWKKEFNLLNLPKRAFLNDVMEKLMDYEKGVPFK